MMFRKYFSLTLAAALLSLSAVAVCAQTGALRGHVKLKQADGTMAPAAGAVIDVFRTDISGKYDTKTDKRGEFVFAGLPFVGTYVIAASLPGAQPDFQPNVKAGKEIDYELVLSPGDGKRLTLDEVTKIIKSGGAKTGTGTESSADKAKRAEMEAKNREIMEKNKKAEESNSIVARTFKGGNEALLAGSEATKANNRDEAIKKYGEAITQYDEGLAADAEQPALQTNKALALKARGVDRYNAAITNKDDAAKNSGLEEAKSDFRAAAEAFRKGLDLMKAQPAAGDPAAQTRAETAKLNALKDHAEAMRLYVTKADVSQADAGLAAYQEYITAEPDAAKKAKAQMDAAQMLLDAGVGDKAFAEFQKILATTPDNPDANLGAGLSLFSTGDKTKYQEAANYLQHFVDLAPDTHKFKADAKAILTELKSTENVVPEKTTPARRRRP